MKKVAILSLCVVMFAAVQPACAGGWGEAFVGGVLGGIGGFLLGGPVGAFYGAVGGAAVGGADDQTRTEMFNQASNQVAEDLANATVRGADAAWNAPSGQKWDSFKGGFGQHFIETYPPMQ